VNGLFSKLVVHPSSELVSSGKIRYTKTGPILVPVGQRLRVIPFDGVNYGIYIVQNMKILSDKISPAVAG